MIIILEGPDGSGKTTLAKTLAQVHNLEYHHEGPPPTHIPPLEYYGQLLEDARWRDSPRSGTIFDRFALGQLVYGPIFRKDDRFTDAHWRIFHRQITAAGAFQILCLPLYATAKVNWQNNLKGEMIKDAATYHDTYRAFANLTRGQYVYDYQVHDLNFLRDNGQLPPGVVGSVAARYLFVFERGAINLPFVDMSEASLKFHDALYAAGYTEHELAFTIARRTDYRQLIWPSHVKVIAIGRRAENECLFRRRPHEFIAENLDFEVLISELKRVRRITV